ncbi:MAG: hypothetical protein Q9168_002412 [Polycauliona sp. 1 TL-2023]
MKFGRQFPKRQALQWSPFYLDYHALKTLAKAACIEVDVSWQDVLDALDQAVDRIERFYTDRLHVILHEKSELFDAFHISQDHLPDAFSLPVHRGGWEAFHESSRNIFAHLVELQQFGALNREAVLRILSKVGRSSRPDTPDADRCRNKIHYSAFAQQTQAVTTPHALEKGIKRIWSEFPAQDRDPDLNWKAPHHSVAHRQLKQIEGDAKSSDTVLFRNSEGNTPLHLAVIAGTLAHVQSLLRTYHQLAAKPNDNEADQKLQTVLSELLPLAVRSRKPDIVTLLLHSGADANHKTSSGETALYLAAQYGYDEIISILLDAEGAKTTLKIYETSRRWTPLFIACVEGHLPVTRLLVTAGADHLQPDRFGWTPREHATYRGHLSLARLLAPPVITKPLSSSSSVMNHRSRPFLARGRKILPGLSTDWQNSGPVSNDKTHILVTLGSPNTRDSGEAVALNANAVPDLHQLSLSAGYTIEVHAIAAAASDDAKGRLQLPVIEEMINDPWHFTTGTPEQVKLIFTISATDSQGNGPIPIASAVALLQSLRHGLARNREGLTRYHTIPISSKDTLSFLGTVTFGLLLVTPPPLRKHVPQMAKQGFWKEGGPTQVIGHRGSGANSAANMSLQLGENTLQSYQSAVKLGASGVEFDVQLTKDLIPVIFHDFLVMEAGGDTPLYTLRLNQFQHLSEAQVPKSDLTTTAEIRYAERNNLRLKMRSRSVGLYEESRRLDLADRMKHTESAMAGDHKGNLRGDSIQGAFPTLENMFTELPATTAFNVEMKYPMLWEAEDRHMDYFATEINAYVDIVLSTIDRLAGKRSITFSSFSPEVCILLTLKQRDYPVLFLSKGGSVPVGDIRCSGLQQSIRFATSWNLAGIVILSDPLVMCPRMIEYAKSTGLKVCSYGPWNNDPECAKVCCTT